MKHERHFMYLRFEHLCDVSSKAILIYQRVIFIRFSDLITIGATKGDNLLIDEDVKTDEQ